MKKFLASIVAAAAVLSIAPAAHAVASLTPTFDVDITLNTACKVATPPSNVVFAYTAFGAAVASSGGAFGIQCTNALIYTLTLDAVAVTDTATNLAYSLALVAGSTGTGSVQNYTITGAMIAGQAGSCSTSTASCTNALGGGKTRTVTVAY